MSAKFKEPGGTARTLFKGRGKKLLLGQSPKFDMTHKESHFAEKS